MDIHQARFNMIEQQIRPWNVLDNSVLSLLSIIKREDFVPATYQDVAFIDLEIPIPEGQCMLSPRLEARMLQALQLHKHEKVLEIGAGSGFMAALMAHKAQRVLSLEIHPELVALATQNLRRAGIMNAEIRQADGVQGAPQDGPFDVIILSGSVATLPSQLLQQLKPGGRLLAIVGHLPIMQAVLATTSPADGSPRQQILFDVVAPRLVGFPEPSHFRF